MADVEDLLRTSLASGSVLPEEVSSSQTAVPISQTAISPVAETVAPATRAAVPSVADSVDRTGSGIDPPPSPPGDNSGNDSGGEDSAADGPIEVRLPFKEERPWSAPPGWICLYSQYFLQSRLWFPLPRLLTSYATKRDVAISQMSPVAIRNMVISLVLGAEADVDVDAEFFEMISQMNLITGETFSVSIKARCRLMKGRGPSKVDGWQQKYFFVRVNHAYVADPSAVFRTEWNPEPVTNGKCRSLPSWTSDRLNRILGSGRLSWGVLTVERVRRSIPRITTVSGVVTSGPSLIAESSKRRGNASAGKMMGKVKRDIPVYNKVMSGTASALPSASLGGSGPSSALVPVTTPPAAPTVDSSVAAIRSSPDKTVDGGDQVSTIGLSDLGAPMVSPPATSSPLGALTIVGPGIVDASEQLPADGSKKRKRTRAFVFDDHDSSSPTPEDCVRFLHSFRLSSSSMPDVQDLSFVLEYVEWASCEAQAPVRRSRARMRLLAEERERSSAAFLSLKASEETSSKLDAENRGLRTEVAQLKASRAELVESERRRFESAMSARFGGFVEKVRRYLSDRDVVRPQVLIESQLSGVVSFLKLFINKGIPIRWKCVPVVLLYLLWCDFLCLYSVGEVLRLLSVIRGSLVFVRVRSRLRDRVGVFRPFTESVSSLGGGRDSARLTPCLAEGGTHPGLPSVRYDRDKCMSKLDTAYPITDLYESGLSFAVGSAFLGPSPRAFLL
ncbi:hypothetical protein F2Q69_00060346 [Brassica cretica]|uniref:Uncharacterized protein n=1 Tax=Brassica cretica TaxID=69181 RepID=A0A8S9RDW1_BRACR|nr:hypothetical protein F2Q69_00060346 [Brassica cretica]